MDPESYCVYNVTRNALLSERVVSVSEPQTPSQLLALVMNGPGRDPRLCIRFTDVSIAPEIPRLFAFDVAYLDSEQRILKVADIGPGTPFPPLPDGVASILFLSDQLLPKSNTEAGDYIRICTEAELAALLRATAQFETVEAPGWPVEAAGPSIPPDPFAGSLIYLPTSGTPQVSEVFLASRSPQPEAPLLPSEEASAEPFANLADSTPAVSDEPPPVTFHEIQSPQEVDPNRPISSTHLSPRFFETAFIQAPPTEKPLDETQRQQPLVSQPSQLPFSLKAVIQFVDDQLRREQEQQEQGLTHALPEEKTEPASTPVAKTFARPEIQEQPPLTDKPPSSSAREERDEILPGLSTAYIPELLEIHETAIGEPESESEQAHPLSLPEIASEEIAPLPLPTPKQLQASVSLQHGQIPEPAGKTAPQLPSPPAVKPLPSNVRGLPPAPANLNPEVERATRTFLKEKLPFAARVQRWLAGESISLSGNRRRGERVALPGLVAFYFTGGAPKPHEIVNISTSGLYLRSKELWSLNTLVRMTLERLDAERGEKKSISVLARVVRVDDGGIGHEFVTTEVLARIAARDFLPQQGTNRKELEKFLAGPK